MAPKFTGQNKHLERLTLKLGHFVICGISFLLARVISLLLPVNLRVEFRNKVFCENIEALASKALKMGEKIVAIGASLVKKK